MNWKNFLKDKWIKRALATPAHELVLYAMDIQSVQTLHGKHVTMDNTLEPADKTYQITSMST